LTERRNFAELSERQHPADSTAGIQVTVSFSLAVLRVRRARKYECAASRFSTPAASVDNDRGRGRKIRTCVSRSATCSG
jgi:hypothetical protein